MRRLIIVTLTFFVLAGCSYVANSAWTSGEFTLRSLARWNAGGTPMTVKVTVTDVLGRPIKGAHVFAQDLSGATEAVTDSSGSCLIQKYEREFTGLEVNDVWVIDSWHSREISLPQRGVVVRVRMLRL